MLKTCSKCNLLWLKDGEGPDLSRGERSDKNSHRSLRDLGFGVGDKRERALGVLVCFEMKWSTLTLSGWGLFIDTHKSSRLV